MLSIRSKLLLTGAASLLLVSACSPQQPAQPAAPTVVKEAAEATVDGVAINKSRVDLIVKQSGGQADTPEARKAIVDKLAMQLVIANEAVKKGLDKSPEVGEQIDLIKQSVLANAYVQDFIKNNPVTDDMMKAEYERLKATVTGTEYKARHILVDKEADAKEIIAKLKKDVGLFAKLAKEKSKDTGSGAQGGELGWFNVSGMVPEFGAAVAQLEKGKFSESPVKTQFGYHVILLEDSKPSEAPAFDDVKANLGQQLAQQNLKKQLDELKAKAKIEIVAAPAAPAAAPAAPAAAAPAAAEPAK